MSRTYWIDAPATWAEGRSLDAALCRESIIGNTEAVQDESGWDQCILLPSLLTASSGFYFGPVVVPIRFDRNGMCRKLGIRVFAGGNTDAATLRVWLTPVYREPGASYDDLAEFELSSGAPVWSDEVLFEFDRDYLPDQRRHAETASWDRMTVSRFGYAVVDFESVATSPTFGGIRFREVVRS